MSKGYFVVYLWVLPERTWRSCCPGQEDRLLLLLGTIVQISLPNAMGRWRWQQASSLGSMQLRRRWKRQRLITAHYKRVQLPRSQPDFSTGYPLVDLMNIVLNDGEFHDHFIILCDGVDANPLVQNLETLKWRIGTREAVILIPLLSSQTKPFTRNVMLYKFTNHFADRFLWM